MIPQFLNRRTIRSLSLLILLAFGTGLSGCAKKAETGPGGFAPPPTPVEVAAVSQEPVTDRFRAVGTIEAGEAITVVSEIDALVTSLPFREGQPVARGGLIARLDDDQLRAELTRALAIRDQNRLAHDRMKALVEKGAGAQQELDNTAALLKVGEANVLWAESRLSKTRITAPFSGILGSRKVSPGAFVRSGDAITDLAQIEQVKVTFSAPERYLGTLQQGSAVTVSTPAFPGYELNGTIDVVEPVLDPGTRSTRLIARVPNPDGRLRPGMSADVGVVLASRAEALTIPNEAVFAEGATSFVFVVKPDSTVTRTAVELGTRQTNVVEVLKGLEPGMRVVRTGHQKLYEGAKVSPVTAGAPPAGAQIP
jgi:membrane fusion protein (multidrug efflux system)